MEHEGSCVLHALPILSSFTSSFSLFLAKRASYEALYYAVFSIHLSHHPSSVQLFSSATCSKTSSVYVIPLMSVIKFHTYTTTNKITILYNFYVFDMKQEDKRVLDCMVASITQMFICSQFPHKTNFDLLQSFPNN
jgi:hypothetical protein